MSVTSVLPAALLVGLALLSACGAPDEPAGAGSSAGTEANYDAETYYDIGTTQAERAVASLQQEGARLNQSLDPAWVHKYASHLCTPRADRVQQSRGLSQRQRDDVYRGCMTYLQEY